jgi:hypothetical protein
MFALSALHVELDQAISALSLVFVGAKAEKRCFAARKSLKTLTLVKSIFCWSAIIESWQFPGI